MPYSIVKTFSPIPVRLTLLIILGLCLTACISLHTKTPEGEPIYMSDAEFAQYFEKVFRHHNQVVNESLYSLGTGESAADNLNDAEMNMDHACHLLNEVASISATGGSPSFWEKWKLLEAVPECETATRRLERLLPHSP